MKNDGGQAFPSAGRMVQTGVDIWENTGQMGMTLRDYFAAKALAGYLASYSGCDVKLPPADHAAGWAYAYADAMITERSKE